MVTKNLIGQPFPLTHQAFQNNKTLARVIRQIESCIEIKHDMVIVERALNCALAAQETKNQAAILQMFNCIPLTLSEGLFSSAIMLYSKAFTESQGRIRLSDKLEKIFPDGANNHIFILELRHGVYAHQLVEANRHQLFFFPNSPAPGRIRLNPEGQTERAIFGSQRNIDLLLSCCKMVANFLNAEIHEKCKFIEDHLSIEEIAILNSISKTDCFEDHWKESPKNRKSNLSKRTT